jgi:predicted negative regulator of RcsB-dependent stress response
MAALDMHEQEQVDVLKAWWKENGTRLILAAVLVVVVVVAAFGWKTWQGKQHDEAAALFDEVVKQAEANDPKRMDEAAAILVSKYGSTVHAARAQLLAAQINLIAKNDNAATGQLQWVTDHASDEGLRTAARLKLAGLRLDEKKFDEALKLLDGEHPEAYNALYEDMRGDIYLAQGKKEEARAAYKQALEKSVSRGIFASLVQVKIDALGGDPAEKQGAGK